MDIEFAKALAYLDSVEKLVELKKNEFLAPENIFKVLNIDYRDITNLCAQSASHGSFCFYYSTLAAKLNYMLFKFEETVLSTYLAHCRVYGSLYCQHLGKKDTKEAITDCMLLLFNSNNTEDMNKLLAVQCMEVQLKESMEESQLVQYRASSAYVTAREYAYKEMYKYTIEGKPYSWFMEMKGKLEERKKIAEGLIEALKCSSIAATHIFKNLQANGQQPISYQAPPNVVNRAPSTV